MDFCSRSDWKVAQENSGVFSPLVCSQTLKGAYNEGMGAKLYVRVKYDLMNELWLTNLVCTKPQIDALLQLPYTGKTEDVHLRLLFKYTCSVTYKGLEVQNTLIFVCFWLSTLYGSDRGAVKQITFPWQITNCTDFYAAVPLFLIYTYISSDRRVFETFFGIMLYMLSYILSYYSHR